MTPPEPEQGCLNVDCKLRLGPSPQQHTNGGCNCLRDIPTPLRIKVERKLAYLAEEIRKRDQLALHKEPTE